MKEWATQCAICGDSKSEFVLNNKRVCLECDDLLFDIEIEIEEMETAQTKEPERLLKAA